MWVFTESGFVSAVCGQHGSGTVKVRARDLESLQPLVDQTGSEVIKSPNADYPYRVIISKDEFGSFLAKSLELMEYTNFKSQVHATRGSDFAHALSSVWSTMHDVEDDSARI
jgi:hypothetical protein